jgi:hypothetical protein
MDEVAFCVQVNGYNVLVFDIPCFERIRIGTRGGWWLLMNVAGRLSVARNLAVPGICAARKLALNL